MTFKYIYINGIVSWFVYSHMYWHLRLSPILLSPSQITSKLTSSLPCKHLVFLVFVVDYRISPAWISMNSIYSPMFVIQFQIKFPRLAYYEMNLHVFMKCFIWLFHIFRFCTLKITLTIGFPSLGLIIISPF